MKKYLIALVLSVLSIKAETSITQKLTARAEAYLALNTEEGNIRASEVLETLKVINTPQKAAFTIDPHNGNAMDLVLEKWFELARRNNDYVGLYTYVPLLKVYFEGKRSLYATNANTYPIKGMSPEELLQYVNGQIDAAKEMRDQVLDTFKRLPRP
jgi:hypothetical protein